jgi:hypothetical protein
MSYVFLLKIISHYPCLFHPRFLPLPRFKRMPDFNVRFEAHFTTFFDFTYMLFLL